jgi:hypothetical protein
MTYCSPELVHLATRLGAFGIQKFAHNKRKLNVAEQRKHRLREFNASVYDNGQ